MPKIDDVYNYCDALSSCNNEWWDVLFEETNHFVDD